jgi:hypothetical protein
VTPLAVRVALLALAGLACTSEEPPTPVPMGHPFQVGEFTLRVAKIETVLTQATSGTDGGLGLSVFVRLSLIDPRAASEIAALVEKEERIASKISNMRATRGNLDESERSPFDDSELTDSLVDAAEKREELARIRPRSRLFTQAIRVVDEEGKEYRLSGFVMEKTYATQMRFREGSTEELFRWLATLQEHAGYTQGESGQEWVLLFQLPRGGGNMTLLIKNPEPREGQPRLLAVALGRP